MRITVSDWGGSASVASTSGSSRSRGSRSGSRFPPTTGPSPKPQPATATAQASAAAVAGRAAVITESVRRHLLDTCSQPWSRCCRCGRRLRGSPGRAPAPHSTPSRPPAVRLTTSSPPRAEIESQPRVPPISIGALAAQDPQAVGGGHSGQVGVDADLDLVRRDGLGAGRPQELVAGGAAHHRVPWPRRSAARLRSPKPRPPGCRVPSSAYENTVTWNGTSGRDPAAPQRQLRRRRKRRATGTTGCRRPG